MTRKAMVRKLVSDVFDIMRRRDYGLGECGYYFHVWGWDLYLDSVTDEDYEVLEAYDLYDDSGVKYEERKRLREEQRAHFDAWQSLVNEAEEMARQLDEMGVMRVE